MEEKEDAENRTEKINVVVILSEVKKEKDDDKSFIQKVVERR